MASVYKVGRTWTVAWSHPIKKRKDGAPLRQYARGLPSRSLANMVAESKEFSRHAVKHGLMDEKQERYGAEADKGLEHHLRDYGRWLKGKGRTEEYAKRTPAEVRRVFAAAGIERIDRIERFKVEQAIASLGALRAVQDDNLSHRSRNKALAACKSFVGWLFDHERIPVNVLARMHGLNVDLDQRRVRKPLDADEFTALYNAALAGPWRGGMSGEDRAIRYLLGASTGFRQGTLFALTPENFHLDGEPPFVEVEAKSVKSRKKLAVPLDTAVAAMVRPWLSGKAPRRCVFTKSKGAKTIVAYRADLEAAGLTYHEEGTALYRDQHSQRNAFITDVIVRGGLKEAQDLAGHSTPALTSRYGRLGMRDYAKAVKGLVPVKVGNVAKQQPRKSG
jgi:site-specific recombinase XerC